MKVLFLDCDGVLNGSQPGPGQAGCLIWRECVAHLNRVVEQTGCRIVVSSTWRQHVIQPHYMTVKGFGFVLRTHGLRAGGNGVVFGQTAHDKPPTNDTEADLAERARQCREWVDNHRERYRVTTFAAVDDEDHRFAQYGVPFVRTDGRFGMLESDADRLIELLGPISAMKAPPVGTLPSACRDCGGQILIARGDVRLDAEPSKLGDVLVGLDGEGVRLVGAHLNRARASEAELYRRHSETCPGRSAVVHHDLGGEGG